MRFELPSNVRHDRSGFKTLINLHATTKDCCFDNIDIDMAKTRWFDADMCATFGAILCRLSDRVNTINVINILPDVKKILSKNGFLSHYGHENIPDHWGTTIAYKKFNIKDERYFADYIANKLMHRSEIPNMSAELKKKFSESIFEIFSNAVSHSGTKLGIFSCGQFFPSQNRLNFSIADLGMGICKNIREKRGLELTPIAAIEWATMGSNTTRSNQIPGGLGLKLLVDFIDKNNGKIQIVSDAGYWERSNHQTTTDPLSNLFPGTVVNIEINTADKQSYILSSPALSENDIF